MPDAPELVTLRSRDGLTVSVPVNQAGSLLEAGYTPETGAQGALRAQNAAREDVYGGAGGAVEAALAGGARSISFGGSDALIGALGGGEDLDALREVHPYASAAGEIGGGLAAAFAAPESLLARSPAGLVSGIGARIAGLGEGAGLAARAGYGAAGAAFEGAAQGAGSYVSDVALGDRELSADGFMGAMGKGALWGGVAGGSLAVAGDGLLAARRLFPKQEITKEAVQVAEQTAKQEISSAVEDGETLAEAARNRLREIRAQRAAMDINTKATLDAIAVREAETVSAANARAAEARAQAAEARAARAKDGPKRTRKAMQGEGPSPTATPSPETAATGEAVGEAPAIASQAAAGATEDTATALERQLAATKQGLDAGKTLAELNDARVGLKPTHIEDALNAEIAKVDPEAQRLVSGLERLESSQDSLGSWLDKYKGGSVSKFERGQAARDWADRVRPKEAGYYTKLAPDSQTPGMMEGGIGLPRGKQMVWRGSEEERALADARTMSKLSPEEQLSAEQAVEAAASRRSKRIADDVTAPPEEAPHEPVQAKVEEAIKAKTDSIDDDIHESSKVISQHEAASADLVEALGPDAPSSAVVRAQGFREAQQKAERSTKEATARTTEQAEKAADTIRLNREVTPGAHGKARDIISMAQDAGAAIETLRMLGIDVPDPKNIPVVGPLLSAYLKARVLGKTFGRFGGKIAETAETTIASKAAQTKQRVFDAVDKMTEAAAKVTSKAAGKIGAPATILAHKLFDDDAPRAKPAAYSSQIAPKGTLAEIYLARADEMSRAMQPGAIEKAVRARVHTSDPTIVDAITEAQTRKLQFIDSKMPKPAAPPVPTQVRMPWVPSKAEINQWSRYVEAAEDPAAVMEAAANGGHVSIEAVETLKAVYPKLYAEAQQRILTRALEAPEQMPFPRRVQLSIMFDMPMDGSQTPEGAAFLGAGYKAPPPAPSPQMPPLTPTVTADVRMADRVDPTT